MTRELFEFVTTELLTHPGGWIDNLGNLYHLGNLSHDEAAKTIFDFEYGSASALNMGFIKFDYSIENRRLIAVLRIKNDRAIKKLIDLIKNNTPKHVTIHMENEFTFKTDYEDAVQILFDFLNHSKKPTTNTHYQPISESEAVPHTDYGYWIIMTGEIEPVPFEKHQYVGRELIRKHNLIIAYDKDVNGFLLSIGCIRVAIEDDNRVAVEMYEYKRPALKSLLRILKELEKFSEQSLDIILEWGSNYEEVDFITAVRKINKKIESLVNMKHMAENRGFRSEISRQITLRENLRLKEDYTLSYEDPQLQRIWGPAEADIVYNDDGSKKGSRAGKIILALAGLSTTWGIYFALTNEQLESVTADILIKTSVDHLVDSIASTLPSQQDVGNIDHIDQHTENGHQVVKIPDNIQPAVGLPDSDGIANVDNIDTTTPDINLHPYQDKIDPSKTIHVPKHINHEIRVPKNMEHLPVITREKFVAEAHHMKGVDELLHTPNGQALLAEAQSQGLKGTELLQFVAQCAHETQGFTKLEEAGSHRYFRKYEPNHTLGQMLGNKHPGDGELYKGRGFIHITGRHNYEVAAKALHMPELVEHPELGSKPDVAAKIAVWYWKTRVQDHVHDFSNTSHVTQFINPNELKNTEHNTRLHDRHQRFLDLKKFASFIYSALNLDNSQTVTVEPLVITVHRDHPHQPHHSTHHDQTSPTDLHNDQLHEQILNEFEFTTIAGILTVASGLLGGGATGAVGALDPYKKAKDLTKRGARRIKKAMGAYPLKGHIEFDNLSNVIGYNPDNNSALEMGVALMRRNKSPDVKALQAGGLAFWALLVCNPVAQQQAFQQINQIYRGPDNIAENALDNVTQVFKSVKTGDVLGLAADVALVSGAAGISGYIGRHIGHDMVMALKKRFNKNRSKMEQSVRAITSALKCGEDAKFITQGLAALIEGQHPIEIRGALLCGGIIFFRLLEAEKATKAVVFGEIMKIQTEIYSAITASVQAIDYDDEFSDKTSSMPNEPLSVDQIGKQQTKSDKKFVPVWEGNKRQGRN